MSSEIPSDSNLLQEIAEEFKKNPEATKATIRKIVLTNPARKQPLKPNGWAMNSNAPYYQEKFALGLKPVIDEIWDKKESRLIPYSSDNLSRSSLRLKVYSAFMYLVDKLDTPDKHYAITQHCIVIRMRRNGILLDLVGHSEDDGTIFKSIPVEKEIAEPWRIKLTYFLENAPYDKPGESKLDLKDLDLTAEIVSELINLLIPLEDIQYKVTNSRILVIKSKEQS